MSQSSRHSAIGQIADSPLLPADGRSPGGEPIPELFGRDVFGDEAQRQRLPRAVYKALRATIERGVAMAPELADSVATAMKDWALDNGATHYTHWFQPMTGFTAEKHDSFLTPSGNGRPLMEFSGQALVQGEPDASSFPSGGLRATFEARGYTAWDPTSPAFLRRTATGATLTIPSAFCSWTGEALDKKTPLLRAGEAVSRAGVRLLHLLGDTDVGRITPMAGIEQEYFLIDRRFYFLRPDLVACGRTVLGARPLKGQEFNDHYFGSISERVLEFMIDLERELWSLGIPIKTRHNEVAPSQFELAPVYDSVTVSADQNMLTMAVLKDVARHHGLTALLHEKPFAGLNGSGKHLNWSLSDDLGRNLLDPGRTPHENLKFMLFLTAIVRGVDLHQDLLRIAIASAGNDHRLGAHEAPPSIISIFMGSLLEELIESLIEGRAPRTGNAERLALGVTALPDLPRDISDRNRTSPFAFTGNKFEFRAVSSNQSVSYPAAFLSTIVAESLDHFSDQLEARGGGSPTNVEAVVREALGQHRRILFAGDNYSAEWHAEAEKRGLLNKRTTPDAIELLTSKENIDLFERYGVMRRGEIEARQLVMSETYFFKINAEAIATRDLAFTSILPAATAYQLELARAIDETSDLLGKEALAPQVELLETLTRTIGETKKAVDSLLAIQEELELADLVPLAKARGYADRILPAMLEVRSHADLLERLVDDERWPLPKYREMLFLH